MYQPTQTAAMPNSVQDSRFKTALTPPYPMQTPTFVWVNGLEMAMNWPVPIGSSVIMMDSQNPALYIKTVDATGRALPIEVYDLVKREPDPKESYVTRGEIEDLFEKYLGNRNKSNRYYNKNKRQEESEASE